MASTAFGNDLEIWTKCTNISFWINDIVQPQMEQVTNQFCNNFANLSWNHLGPDVLGAATARYELSYAETLAVKCPTAGPSIERQAAIL
jgi:hypothetical protein